MKINKSELRSLIEEVMGEAKPPRFVPKPGLGSTAVGARPSQSRKPTRNPAKGRPNDSVPSAMIYGRENVEVGFINGLKALEKVTAKMEKEGYGDRSLHQKLKKAFANVRKLGSQIGRTEGK